ncbi:MAG: orotate phosphoribosyltransferase [Candidatus Micrarchaeota archaeon]
MEVAGLCDVCGKLTPMFSCSLCGARVCPACFDLNNRVCKNCEKGRKL